MIERILPIRARGELELIHDDSVLKRSGKMRFGNECGISLMETMIAIGLMSLGAIGLMRMMSGQMQANAAIRYDLDFEAVKRSITQRLSCEETQKALPQELPSQGLVPVSVMSHGGKQILPASANGVRIGHFTYRALLNPVTGILDIQGAMLDKEGHVKSHPLLGQMRRDDGKLIYGWKSLTPGHGEPVACEFSLNERSQSEDLRAPKGELSYIEKGGKGYFLVEKADMRLQVSYLDDGGFSCQNILRLTCNNGRSIALSAAGQIRTVDLKTGESCRVEVESVVRSGPAGNCSGGSISGRNGLTAKQGTNLWRIQWEDRLASRTDAKTCANRGSNPRSSVAACMRLDAVDWNDGIWRVHATDLESP